MRYHYIAALTSGKITEGNIDAASPDQVLEWMTSQGYKPISIKAVAEGTSIVGGKLISLSKGLFNKGITLTDKVFVTKYLSLMLKVGTDLFRAIDILIADFEKPAVKLFLSEIRDNLSQGKPFYLAFSQYPQYFSQVEINLIKAGERSGNLEKVFEDLSSSLEKNQELQNKVKSALIYPIILISIASIVMLVMIVLVIPKISGVFSQSTQKPPLFSRIVFAIGGFANNYKFIIFPLFFGGIIFAAYFFTKNPVGKAMLSRWTNRAPVLKNIIHHLAIQRFASTLASLLRAGIPILEALDVTASAVGSDELHDILIRISKEGIAKGMTIGDAFRREPYFPKVVTNLIAISEKAGHMEDILETLSNFYASEVDASVKIFIAVLEPALLLFLGIMVGGIAIAVIIPIYQLVSTV